MRKYAAAPWHDHFEKTSYWGKGKLVFIVWGTKRVEKTLGYVADFCYLCREIGKFKVNSVSMVSHVYYLPTGSPKLVGHYRECTTCASHLNAEPNRYHDFSRRQNDLDLPRLIQTTYPDIEQHYAQRLKLEEELKSSPGQIIGNDRSNLIAEPFRLLSYKVDARFKKINLDFTMVGIFLLTIFACYIAAEIVSSYFPAQVDSLMVILGIICTIGIAALVWQNFRAGQAYMRKSIYPVLATAVRPLRPTAAEIAEVLRAALGTNSKFARKMNLPEFMECVGRGR
jgi:hypothetical protein